MPVFIQFGLDPVPRLPDGRVNVAVYEALNKALANAYESGDLTHLAGARVLGPPVLRVPDDSTENETNEAPQQPIAGEEPLLLGADGAPTRLVVVGMRQSAANSS